MQLSSVFFIFGAFLEISFCATTMQRLQTQWQEQTTIPGGDFTYHSSLSETLDKLQQQQGQRFPSNNQSSWSQNNQENQQNASSGNQGNENENANTPQENSERPSRTEQQRICVQSCWSRVPNVIIGAVCGSDGITYPNADRLRCAQQCQIDVSVRYSGSCVQALPSCPCASTEQHDPVCGSDNTTYTNESKLKCAKQCNQRPDLQLAYYGQCLKPQT